VFGPVTDNYIACLVRDIDPNCHTTSIGVSTDGTTFTTIVTPTAKNNRFTLTAGDIDITVV
jgi:hypothetical protein